MKPGGGLVAATCSLLPAENEAQGEAFLAAYPGPRVVPVRTLAPQLTGSAHPDPLALMPARHDMDGFFAAVMEREMAAPLSSERVWQNHRAFTGRARRLRPMTELLDKAIREAQALPPEVQDALAQVMLSYVGDADTMIQLTPEEEADLIEAQAEMAHGEFATDAEVEAVLSKYRR